MAIDATIKSLKEAFTFVNIVSILFQTILFVGNFLGLLYLFEGNIAFSIAGSLLLTILYFFLIQLLVDNKELMFRNKFKHATSLFWLFYLGLAIASGALLTHFINVEFNVKQEVQNSAYKKLAVVSKSVDKYDSLSNLIVLNYEADLKGKLDKYKIDGSQDQLDTLIESPYLINKKSLLNRANIDVDKMANAILNPIHLRRENNWKHLDSTIKTMNVEYESVFKNWKRLDLMQTYSNLNEYVDKSLQVINKMIGELPTPAPAITASYDKTDLPLSSPSALNKIYKPDYMVPFLVILIIHAFLLITFYYKQIRVYPGGWGQKPSRNDAEPRGEDRTEGGRTRGNGSGTINI